MLTRKYLSSLAAVTVVLAVLAPAARAQFAKLKNTTPEMRAKVQTELMKAKMQLNPAQESQVAALNLKYAQKMEPLIQGSQGPFMEMREAREINEEKEAELKKIVSKEQFEAYLAGKEELREKFEQKIEEKLQQKGGGGQ